MLKLTVIIVRSLYYAVRDAIDHDGVEHAGYISFLFMLSIFPFLILVMTIASILGEESLGNIIIELVTRSSWANFIHALKPRIVEITSSPPQSLLTIAIVSAVWTASSIFEGLRTILNRAFRVNSPPPYIWRRLLSFIEFVGAVSILIAFTLFLVVMPVIVQNFFNLFSEISTLAINFSAPQHEHLRSLALYTFTLFVIVFTFYALPNRRQVFSHMIPGAGFVLVSWLTFSKLFEYYLDYFPQVNFIYGSIAGIIVALLFFYFCSFIFIIGAELNFQLEINLFKKKKKMMSETAIIIPVRKEATRLPNKPLALIAGKPMMLWVAEQASKAKIGDVIFACAEQELVDLARNNGYMAVLTDPALPSGTDRVYAAKALLGKDYKYVVNLQGDLPLVDPALIVKLADLIRTSKADIVTAAALIESEEENFNNSVVKVVVAQNGRALYFTRAPYVPYGEGERYHHIGIYAYKAESLQKFVSLPISPLEFREKLEQLRALENGMTIYAAITDKVIRGVDTLEDLEYTRSLTE